MRMCLATVAMMALVGCGDSGEDTATTATTTATGTVTGGPTGTGTTTSTGTTTGGTSTGTSATGSWCDCLATVTTFDEYAVAQSVVWSRYDCDYWVIEEAFDLQQPLDGPELSIKRVYDADHNLLEELVDADGNGTYDQLQVRTWHSNGLADTNYIDLGNDGTFDYEYVYLNDGTKIVETRGALLSGGVENFRLDWTYDGMDQTQLQEAFEWNPPSLESTAVNVWKADWTWPGPAGGERRRSFDFDLSDPEYTLMDELTLRDDKRIEFTWNDFDVATPGDDGATSYTYLADGRVDMVTGYIYDPSLDIPLAGLDGYADLLVTYEYDEFGYTTRAVQLLDTNRDGDYADTLDIELTNEYVWDCGS